MANNTLGSWIAWGTRVSAKCRGCGRTEDLDIKALSKALGSDFVCVGDPNPLAARLRCKSCGGRGAALTISAGETPTIRGR